LRRPRSSPSAWALALLLGSFPFAACSSSSGGGRSAIGSNAAGNAPSAGAGATGGSPTGGRGTATGGTNGSSGTSVAAGGGPEAAAGDSSSTAGANSSQAGLPGLASGLGAPDASGNDPASHGATITFESIGAPGWYPSRQDPSIGPCDAYESSDCCLTKKTITSDALTPWDEDLILTLRGPMLVKELAVYQPTGDAAPWDLVSAWDERDAASAPGLSFAGNGTEKSGFAGAIGTECLVNVATSLPFACGPMSSPYCPPTSASSPAHFGWSGSKLFVLLASMPHADTVPGPCSKDASGNWYDAPWIGLSVGELVRAGAFVACHCYARDPNQGSLGDGCGQFNAFEVVNDNNQFKNLDVFSTNFIDYAGYVGEGPCGSACGVTSLGADVDLIDKKLDRESALGAVSTPDQGPGAAFRRPETGYRFFLLLLDVPSRTVELALVHPDNVPAELGELLPAPPATIAASTISALRSLRLPH
jgi:hypothetical protein